MFCTGHRMTQPAGTTERSHEGPALPVDIGFMVLSNVLCGPRIELTRQRAVPIVEKRPGEIAGIAHDQLPSKRGFCFATNAL